MSTDPSARASGRNLVAVLHTAALSRGTLKGYGLIVTHDALIGAKKYTDNHYLALLSNLDESGRRGAQQVASTLMQSADFEVAHDEIVAIDIKPPGRFKPGALMLRSGTTELKLTISGTFGTGSKQLPEILVALLDPVAPEKVHMA